MLNCLTRRLVAVTFHPFPKSSVHQLGYWLRTPNRISMILGLPNVGNPSFINPSIVRNCPDYAIFAHESRLQTALNHMQLYKAGNNHYSNAPELRCEVLVAIENCTL